MRDFLKVSGLVSSDNESNRQTKSDEKQPDSNVLMEIYKQHLSYIQHREVEELKLFIMVIAIVGGLWVLSALPFFEMNKHHGFGIMLIVILLTSASNHITIKNAVSKWSYLLILSQIEKALGLRKNGILPAGTQCVHPVSFGDFVARFIYSHAGPKSLVYTFITALAIIELQWDVFQIQSFSLYFLLLLLPFALTFASIYANYLDIIQQFKAIKGETEPGVIPGVKSQADEYCDLADALLQMHPPIPSEAIKHFREALRIEPDNVRARVGYNKLINWKFKNVN